jgi:hypothetical protein
MQKPIKQSASRSFDKMNTFLDRYVLPWPVRFLTFRFVILATIALLIPLIVFASNTVMVLGINSYLNTMSVAVSSIVLLYATLAEANQKQIAQMQEQRAQEDHTHVTEMHQLILETLTSQQQEIDALKQMIAEMMNQPYTAREYKPTPDLHALHPRGEDRFSQKDLHNRYQENLYQSDLAETLREDFTPESR